MRALVTGAGGRLGRAMALWLGRSGWDVAVHYASSAEGAEETAAAIREVGQRAIPLQADLLDWDAAEALVPHAADALGGPLTLLVNNASIFEADDFFSFTESSWERHIGSNLRAPLQLLRSFASQAPEPARDARGEPVAQALAVNMIDQRVRKLNPNFVTYTLAKSALWTLTRTAAQGLAPRLRVNAIGPGPTLADAELSDEAFLRQRAATVLQRGSDPDDITGALAYLIGAKSVTGQLICTDGGQHLGWKTPDIRGS